MCLYPDKEMNEQFNNMKHRDRAYHFYKVFFKHNNLLKTPYQGFKISSPGIMNAKGILSINSSGGIERGACHAFLRKRKALREKDLWNLESGYKIAIVRISVNTKDIISFGVDNDVCFSKYRITKSEWNKHFQGK